MTFAEIDDSVTDVALFVPNCYFSFAFETIFSMKRTIDIATYFAT